jgi:hypothetical protein
VTHESFNFTCSISFFPSIALKIFISFHLFHHDEETRMNDFSWEDFRFLTFMKSLQNKKNKKLLSTNGKRDTIRSKTIVKTKKKSQDSCIDK